MKPKTPAAFNNAVQNALDRMGGGAIDKLAAAVGVSPAMMTRYIAINEWPDHEDRIAAVCRFVGLPEKTLAAVKAAYTVRAWKVPRRTAVELAKAEGKADKLQAARQKGLARLTYQFKAAGAENVMAVTTQTIMPLLFKPESYRPLVDEMHAAIGRGLLILFVVPTDHRVLKLTSEYRFNPDSLHEYAAFKAGFDAFRAGLRPSGGGGVELYAHEEFPMTPCGRIVTLFTEVTETGGVDLTLMERGPGENGPVTWPPPHGTSEDRVRLYVSSVIKRDIRVCSPPAARRQFGERVLDRMHGRGT